MNDGDYMTRFRITFILCLIGATAAWAQLTRGFISGTIQDQSGLSVPGVAVRIVNQATNIERTSATNDSGVYRFVGVDPGKYTVEFTKSGFEARRVNDITVSTTQEVTINQTLQIGQTASVVEVVASPGVELSKTSATIERTLSHQFIANVPLTAGTRDVNQLALLAPTAVRGPGSTGISANGQRARNNNFLLDGIDNNDPSVTIANNRVIPEAVQEFQVQTSSYSAEYGRNSGAQIIVNTRSGSNQFHGEAYDYYNGNWLTPVTLPNKRNNVFKTPRFDQNQAGGDLGGPIIRDRTFFFVLGEANRRREAPSAGNATSATIPTPAGFAALSGVPLDPAQNATSRQAVLGALGFLPSVYKLNPGFTNVRNVAVNGVPIQFGSVSIPLANPFDFWYGTLKVDHRLTSRDNIFYRVTTDHRTQPDVTSNVEFGNLFSAGQEIFRQNHVIGETHIFSPAVTNQFSFGYIRGLLNFPENDPKTPATGISGLFDIGGLSNFPQGRVQNEFQFTDSLGYQIGRHSLKVGADIRRLRLYNVAAFDSKGTFSFDNFADFLNNRAASLVQALNTATFDARQLQQFYFFQDDFKVTKNLTLNLGLRYEYSNIPFGFFGATDAESLAALVPGPVKADTNNWAPRAGLAYSPSFQGGLLGALFGDGATVFRGGYGIGYDVLFFNILTVNASNYPRVVSLRTDRPDLVNVYPNIVSGRPPSFTPTATYVNSPSDLQNPTTHFYSFSIQRQFRKDYIFELGYSGARSYHGIGQGQLNAGILNQAQADLVNSTKSTTAIPSLQARRVFSQFGSRVLIQTTAKGNYNAGYVKFDKRFSRGLLMGFNYTYSGTFSDNDESLGVGAITSSSPQIPQNFNDFRSEYSRSAFDRPHRYAVYFNYDVPWFHGGALGSGVMRRVFAGWTFAGFSEAQSGQPFTVRTGVDTYGVGSTAARPDSNPSGQITLDPVSQNYRTFTTPLNGTGLFITPLNASGLPLANSRVQFGNLGRNTFRGPGLDNQNLSIIKKIAITERVSIGLRADFIDAFNHRNFLNPVSAMNSPVFGQNLSDPGGRSVLLSARVQF